jgi:ATP-dependent Lon protease
VVSGIDRFQIQHVNWSAGYCLADIEYRQDTLTDWQQTGILLRRATRRFTRYVEGITRITGRTFTGIRISQDPAVASWDLTTRLPLHTWERQHILEIDDVAERLQQIIYRIDRENALLFKGGAAGLAMNHAGGSFSVN